MVAQLRHRPFQFALDQVPQCGLLPARGIIQIDNRKLAFLRFHQAHLKMSNFQDINLFDIPLPILSDHQRHTTNPTLCAARWSH